MTRLVVSLMLAATPAAADIRSAGIRRAVHMLGDSDQVRMDAAVDSALDEEAGGLPEGLDAPLLLALAWSESRFDPGARPLCGVMQVSPRDLEEPRSSCRVWRRDLAAGMAAGVREIEKILREIPRVRRELHRALEYRACGGKAFTRHCRKGRWVRRVEALAERIRARPFHIDAEGGR